MAVQNNYNNVLRDGLSVALTGSAGGDIFYRAGNGAFTRLAVGTEGQVLKVSNASTPTWADQLSIEDIQDAIAGSFQDSETINLTYDDVEDKMVATIIDGSVTAAKLTDGAITDTKLAIGSVTSEKLTDGSITTAKLGEGSITSAKLRDSAATSLMGRSSNTTGIVGDIEFTADGQVLMRSGGSLVPTNLHDTVITYRVDEFAPPTASVSLSGQRITDLAAPTVGTDAANKVYVDNALQGVPYKSYVRTASDTDIDLEAPGATIGGVALSPGQNFLVYGQEDATENGVYTFVDAASPATRRADLELVPGMTIFVDEGVLGDTTYQLTSNGPITVGASPIDFTIFGRVESITVSSPLVRTGNDIAISDNGITPALFQEFPAGTILGNSSPAAADATYLTKADVLSMLGLATAVSEDYVVEPSAAATLIPNTAFRPTNAALTVFTLPTECPEGATLAIEGSGAGGWSIAQAAGQSIIYGDMSTTLGVSGSIASLHERDVVKLRCIVANTTYQVISSIGNLNIV